jgi:response regulator RpfG family c-di-GMP phosphodiesterase
MYRLLLVDDEPNILHALTRVLGGRRIGQEPEPTYQIEAFDKPAQALERAADQAFDLVISDFRMPVMDGVEFLRRLVQLQPSIARLILSGYADLEALIGAINHVQIFRFIGKPWHELELRQTVAQALQQRELLRENQRLADLLRVARGKLSRQEMELRRLQDEFPAARRMLATRDDGDDFA